MYFGFYKWVYFNEFNFNMVLPYKNTDPDILLINSKILYINKENSNKKIIKQYTAD